MTFTLYYPVSRGKSDKAKYRPYEQGQQFLLPSSLDDLVLVGHFSRMVSGFWCVVLKDVMEDIFIAAVKMLASKGYVRMENYFADGTNTGSASGRYTFRIRLRRTTEP